MNSWLGKGETARVNGPACCDYKQNRKLTQLNGVKTTSDNNDDYSQY